MSRGLLKTRFLFHSLSRRLFSVRSAFMSNQSGDDAGDKCRDHLKRTASTPRLRSFCPVTVSEVRDLSSTVKGITFQVGSHYLDELNFKAGQWVDMLIPEVETVGGFSICNSPSDLMKNNRIVLAVKYSQHPPAHWCNTKCRVGDSVQVRVGGNCFYEFDHKQQPCRPLLLIGGGVGINPLLSIFMHRSDMHGLHRSGDVLRTHLVLTARKKSELLFQDQITSVCESNPAFSCRFHVTKEQINMCQPSSPYRSRRFTPEDLQETISGLTVNSILPECYICGPPPFIERCADLAVEFGLDKNLVHYEKWW